MPASIFAVMVMGCASSKPSQSGIPSDIPDWYFNPPQQEDLIFGTGSARMSDLNMSINMAESRARQSLAFALNANVQAMITDYTSNAGTVENRSNLTFAETIGRQVSNARLAGTTVARRARGKDGTIYVLVSLNKADAARMAADIIDSEAAGYAEFKAMEALNRMEAQLENSAVKPKPIDN